MRPALRLPVTARFGLALGLVLAACQDHQAGSAPDSASVATTPAAARDRIHAAEVAITCLDVGPAAELLQGLVGPEAGKARARLALYVGDCESALSQLAGRDGAGDQATLDLGTVARACHGATTGGVIREDLERGVWIRFQDEADVVLAPLLIDSIVRARTAIGLELGVDLPRPLRLDLVRDLFSLAAVSGLPLEAAETTGTVAVARWGRVTMISPRAMSQGYPWADTLAHELTHLMLSRASFDRAPLWLQEGVAKREEERWRAPRPFDSEPEPSLVAARAAASGQQVGVTQLGPSIAMLPSANAAQIAFAEVNSFMGFWIERNGPRALPLLLRDLAFTKDADSAMRSVSGLAVADWELLWRADLAKRFAAPEESDEDKRPGLGPLQLSRALRLAELLYNEGHADLSAAGAAVELDRAPHVAALRFAAARAATRAGWDHAPELLGTLADLDGPHGGWLAISSRLRSGAATTPQSQAELQHALALDPLLPEVACGGLPFDGWDAPTVEIQPELMPLCAQVRTLPLRGSR